ncbi:cytochrome P450 [Nocardia sp. NPDC006630]|uniref:cytochrome P450 n=1 Tax=Nocardia sp. NPDC006630 TaxID=3157181 RepID=UPI0033A99B1F
MDNARPDEIEKGSQIGLSERELGDPRVPTFPFHFDGITPSEEYAERRARCPLGTVRLASGHDAKLVVKYHDAALALADQRLTHDLRAPGSPRFTLGPSHYDAPSLLNMEGEGHRRIRRIIAPAFTPRRIQRWDATIDRIANDLLDAIESSGPPTDIVSEFCLRLPTRVMCHVLGIPEGDSHRFVEWSNAFVSSVALTSDERMNLIMEFSGYISELLARKRSDPGDSLIDDLIASCDEGDYLTDPELIGLIISLIAAGTDTTASALGRILLTLLSDDGLAWEELCAHQDLIPDAVEETLRLLVMGPSAALRLATDDVELPSGRINAGEAVVIATNSAMRDETVFDKPNTVKFDRGARPPLLVFGKGAHVCLGTNLAKAEIRAALRLLVHRFPTLRLDTDTSALRFTNGEIIHSLKELPVTW